MPFVAAKKALTIVALLRAGPSISSLSSRIQEFLHVDIHTFHARIAAHAVLEAPHRLFGTSLGAGRV
jgi:hypothetical protein